MGAVSTTSWLFASVTNVPEALTREQVALYVHDLAARPNPKGANILSIESGRGLSNATMQQRITVLRLFCDSLVEQQLRQDNPVGRGHYVPGKAFGGVRDRGLLPPLPQTPLDPFGLRMATPVAQSHRGAIAEPSFAAPCLRWSLAPGRAGYP